RYAFDVDRRNAGIDQVIGYGAGVGRLQPPLHELTARVAALVGEHRHQSPISAATRITSPSGARPLSASCSAWCLSAAPLSAASASAANSVVRFWLIAATMSEVISSIS